MNQFVNSIGKSSVAQVRTRTENNAVTFNTSTDPVVDLFFNVGSSRGKDITHLFARALDSDAEMAVRILLWARDVRGGAGERQTFRNLLSYLEKRDPALALRVMKRVPDLGRFDDLFVMESSEALELFADAIRAGNGLAAKWAPRKGANAERLRNALGFSPKRYRKTIVGLSKTVEQLMCAKHFEEINYEHVPSVAMSRYRKAFSKRDAGRFVSYLESVKSGEKKINASAVFPHDVIRGYFYGYNNVNSAIDAQWNALPDYIPEGVSILPMSDVSGSMTVNISGSVTALDVSVALGIYCAERNKSAFKNLWLNFSAQPELQVLRGNTVTKKLASMDRSNWQMNTNLEAAFNLVLKHAVTNKVPAEDMPQVLLILSDMQFDQCVREPNNTLFEELANRYEAAGYNLPQVVFWQLNARGSNVPVSATTGGTALISGYSPAILKKVLSNDMMTPRGIVESAVMDERYNF